MFAGSVRLGLALPHLLSDKERHEHSELQNCHWRVEQKHILDEERAERSADKNYERLLVLLPSSHGPDEHPDDRRPDAQVRN